MAVRRTDPWSKKNFGEETDNPGEWREKETRSDSREKIFPHENIGWTLIGGGEAGRSEREREDL